MSFIDDMKIGKKLTGGFLVVVLILVVVAAIGYVNLSTIAGQGQQMYNHRMVPVYQIMAVDSDIRQASGDMYRYVYIPDARTDAKGKIESAFADMDTRIEAYAATSRLPEEKTALLKYQEPGWDQPDRW
jgi:hypothetical protein